MKRLITLLLLAPSVVVAQTTAPTYRATDGTIREAQGVFGLNSDGTPASSAGSATPTGAAGSPNANVVSVQGVNGGTPQNVNTSQIAGTATATGTGASNAGTQRIVLSSDSPLPPGASTAANQASMLAQMPALAATGSAAPTNGLQTFGLASSTAPTAATTGNGVRAWYGLAGQSASSLVDLSTGNAIGNAIASSTPVSGTSARGLFTVGFSEVWDGSNWQASPGDTNGNRSHGPAGALTDGSGTVTTGGTSQQVFAANTARLFLSCQNPVAATEALFVNIGAAASTTGGSFEIAPGAYREFTGAGLIPSGTINITAASSGHRFVCKQG